MNVMELLSQRMKEKFKQHIVAGDNMSPSTGSVNMLLYSVTITEGTIR